MAIITVAPTKPPVAAVGWKASEITHQNTEGTFSMFMPMMSRHMKTYMMAMKGTILPATAPMRRTPPSSTATHRPTRIRPHSHAGRPKVPEILSVMALACTMPPVPIQAQMPNTAKLVPSQTHLGPRPFLMKYMAPPTQLPAGVFSRKCTESSTSLNLVIMPTRAVTHIQNRAPGPPTAMARATPTTLPVPISAARAVMRAFHGEISPCSD